MMHRLQENPIDVRARAIDPAKILTQQEPLVGAIDAYKAFDPRQPGWLKVKLEPAGTPARGTVR